MTIESHQITFRDDTLHAIQNEQGQVFIAVKPIIESLGLDWSSMLRKLRQDEDLSMVEMTIETVVGPRSAVCLPLELVPALLMQIRPSAKMTPATREKLSLYRREAFSILWQHFQHKYNMGQGSHRADTALLIEDLRQQVRDVTIMVAELKTIHAALPAPAPQTLTPKQQLLVQQGVRDIAYTWSNRGDVARKVAFSRTWTALKEHFGVAKYEQIRLDQWGAVESWLKSRN
jgi:hypothetical protein